MGNFITILKAVMMIIPVLGQLIQVVEEAMPAGGQGAAKLAMVKAMLEKAYGNFSTLTVSFDQVWPMLEPVIASLVSMYKATGIIASTPPASAAHPAQPPAAPVA